MFKPSSNNIYNCNETVKFIIGFDETSVQYLLKYYFLIGERSREVILCTFNQGKNTGEIKMELFQDENFRNLRNLKGDEKIKTGWLIGCEDLQKTNCGFTETKSTNRIRFAVKIGIS